MIIACQQPYFMPWPGFFAKALQADLMVLLDDVQFPLGSSWVSRNRIKTKDGQLWLSVPVLRKYRSYQKIRQVEIFNERGWGQKFSQRLAFAYHHAPYFEDHRPFFDTIFTKHWTRLVDLNLAILDYLRNELALQTPFQLSSELGVASTGSRLLVEICQKTKADVYLSSTSGRKYIDESIFRPAGIEVSYFAYHSPTYPQLWGPFLPNLSIVDLLFNCGPKSRQIIENSCRRIPQ
jgi:hypothetical protein